MILVGGLLITMVSALAGFTAAYVVFKQDFLTVLGVVCGAMTSTPALGAISGITSRPEPVLAYSAVYPVALILITVVCQFLYYLL
jgi:putative transport protein